MAPAKVQEGVEVFLVVVGLGTARGVEGHLELGAGPVALEVHHVGQ